MYEDNLSQFLAEQEETFLTKDHVLEERNNMEYAEHLQNAHGYYVFNPQNVMKAVKRQVQGVLDAAIPLDDDFAVMALEAAGYDDINFLRSYIGEFKDPVRAGEGEREMHPGQWSDVTGSLKAAYTHQVNSRPMIRHAD